jgi:hypothetical protein
MRFICGRRVVYDLMRENLQFLRLSIDKIDKEDYE